MAVEHLSPAPARQDSAVASAAIPHLESGDRLTRAEFERRYAAMPWLKKAELIEGVVYVGSPVRMDAHAEPHSVVVTWLMIYRLATPGLRTGDSGTVLSTVTKESPLTAMRFPRWWPRKFPTGGHEISPAGVSGEVTALLSPASPPAVPAADR